MWCRADAYLEGVETLIARYQADRYFAHRKEADWKLDLIERMGIDVIRPTLPLEIIARRGPIGRHDRQLSIDGGSHAPHGAGRIGCAGRGLRDRE